MRLLCLIGIATLYVALTFGTENFSFSNHGTSQRVNSIVKDVNNSETSPGQTKKVLKIIKHRLRKFSAQFLRRCVYHDTTSSEVISPFSAASVLTMLTGAREDLKEILGILALSKKNDYLPYLGFREIIDSFENYNEGELGVANKIFLDSALSAKPEFIEYFAKVFESTVESLDFQNKFEAKKKIHDWFANQTKRHNIPLLPPYGFASDTAVIISSVVYFKGIWKSRFDPNDTKERRFFRSDKDERCIPTMYAFGRYRYGELPQYNVTFVEIPYKTDRSGNAISMFILRPNNLLDHKKLLKNLETISIAKLRRASKRNNVHLYLTKFKILSHSGYSIPLSLLKMDNMFTIKSNLSKIEKTFDLKFPIVLNNAIIEVDEKGDTAMDAFGTTYKYRNPQSDDRQQDIEFRVDRPFIGIVATTGKIRANVLIFQFTGDTALQPAIFSDKTDDTLCRSVRYT